MAQSTKALREERAVLAKEIRRLSDENLATDADGKFTEAWEKVNADYNALGRKIEISEHADKIEAEMAARVGDPDVGRGPVPGPTPKGGDGAAANLDHLRGTAIRAWCRSRIGRALTEDQVEACRAVGLNPSAPELNLRLSSTDGARAMQRAYRSGHPSRARDRMANIGATLSNMSGPTGAYITPPQSLIRELEINMLAYGGMRQAAETIVTTTGERMAWPTVDDTTNKGVQLGESAAAMPSGGGSGQGTDPTFAQVFWDAYKFSSQAVLVPYELIEDSVFDLGGLLGELFGERLGRITNDKYTFGTGASTPMGIVTKAYALGNYQTAASSTAIAADDLFKLYHAVDPAYRAGASFMMNDQIILALRLLKDGMGRYLWQSGMEDDTPDRLLGDPVVLNQSMDSTTASGKNSVLFGEISKYKIRRVGEARMYHLVERYRDTDQDGFIMLIREDGNLLTAGTANVKVLHHT